MIDLAPGSVHLGWTVKGPSPEGARRWPAERDGKAGTLVLFPFRGVREESNRALAARAAACRVVEHPALERVEAERSGDDGLLVVHPDLGRAPDGPLPPDDALTAIEAAAQALRAFHDRGLAHGELDPWSLVRRADGSWALLPPGLRGPPAETLVLGLQSDPRWAAPEVLDGVAPTPASDVFQLGLLLFRLTTGRPPVPATEPGDAFVARAATPIPEMPQEQAPAVRALYQCLVAEVDRRPKGAAEVLALLDLVIRKKTPTLPERKPPAKVVAVQVALPLVVLLALTFGCFVVWQTISTRYPPSSPTEGYRLPLAR